MRFQIDTSSGVEEFALTRDANLLEQYALIEPWVFDD